MSLEPTKYRVLRAFSRVEFVTEELSGANMSFMGEMKRRKVFQVAAMYAVVAWLLVQVITSVETPLNLPNWVDTFVIVLLAVGFPVALVLGWAFDVTPQGIRPANDTDAAGIARQSYATTLSIAIQAVVLLAVAFLVADQYFLNPGGREEPIQTAFADVTRYNYRLADGEQLVPTTGVSIAVSPNGASFVYVGPAANGRQLWLRDRDKLRSTPVPGSDGATQPFYAPNSRGIGFVTGERSLVIIPKIGDSPLTIVDGGLYPLGASWGGDGYVYYATASGLMRRLAAGGGDPEQITTSEPSRLDEITHGWPDVLPNSKGALFTILKDHSPDQIAVVNFSTGQVRILVEGALGRYAESGHLIYVREDGGLMAARFDQDRLVLSGQGVLLNDQLADDSSPDLAIARTGRLLYITRPPYTRELAWVDRTGTWASVDPDNPIHGMRYVVLSPDNTSVALTSFLRPPSDDSQIWTKKLPHGPLAQLTFEGAVNMRPSWSPDGRSIVFISDRGENRDVWIKRADGTGEAEVLLDDPEVIDEAFYSPNGEWLVHRRGKVLGARDIFAIPTNSDARAIPLVTSDFDEVAPALSSDGRWLAYVSDRAGQANVYVRPFPAADTETQVSVNGGQQPVWARNRPELFYLNDAGEMVSVEVLPGTEFRTGAEQVLFLATAYRADFYHAAYDVTADGERFVMIRNSDSGSFEEQLIVVENWHEELERLAPEN